MMELNKSNLTVDADSIDRNGGKIELSFDTWFDVEKKFGIRLKEGAGLILAALYDPFADTLKMGYDVGDLNESEQFEYQPTEAEIQAIKELIKEAVQEQYDQTPKEFCQQLQPKCLETGLPGDSEMTREELRVDDDIQISDDNQSIVAYLETWLDVKKKFNEDLETEEAWLNLYAIYDPFADTLMMEYTVNTDERCVVNEYTPTDNEEQLIKALITEKIRELYDQTPQEFFQRFQDENTIEMGGQT